MPNPSIPRTLPDEPTVPKRNHCAFVEKECRKCHKVTSIPPHLDLCQPCIDSLPVCFSCKAVLAPEWGYLSTPMTHLNHRFCGECYQDAKGRGYYFPYPQVILLDGTEITLSEEEREKYSRMYKKWGLATAVKLIMEKVEARKAAEEAKKKEKEAKKSEAES